MRKDDGQDSLVTAGPASSPAGPFPPDLVLAPVARNPIRLAEETVRTVIGSPVPVSSPGQRGGARANETERASVVVVTHNNLLFTRMCLASVLAHTARVDYEVIVVDNGSRDGTPEFLRQVAQGDQRVRLVLNEQNCGFAPASNQGLALAAGTTLVLLNNDTIVPPGWLAGLIRHLDDPAVGLVGPVTNRTGNEAQIETPYRTFGEFLYFAAERGRSHTGCVFDIPMLTMFCLALSRESFERLGPLDERYETGMFEDDDYSMRARAAGYRTVCAEDVFVHHFGRASLGELTSTGQTGALFQANRRRFEAKWGVQWKPHGRRWNLGYRQLTDRVRELVRTNVPGDATVIVLSKGDDELLDHGPRRAWHFPQDASGAFAGHYPADSVEAIAHLEKLRDRGGEYLIVPHPALWWLDHYSGLRNYLETRCRLVVRRDDTCLIFGLDPESPSPQRGEGTP
jgi:GT2 family glycosyltransferase